MDEIDLTGLIDACEVAIRDRFEDNDEGVAAMLLDDGIVASVCLHREPSGDFVVLSPCGVCRERLAVHGPEVLVAVCKPLKAVLPDYWMTAFPDEVDPAGALTSVA